VSATNAGAPAGVSFSGITNSEWTKLRSVRSSRWCLFLTALFVIAIGILVCLITESRYPDIHRAVHPLESSLVGVNLAQFAVGVLGVLTITAEYSTGMIRSSFCAVPKRLPVLWAKALVFAVVTFVISLPSILIAFFVGQSILSGKHIDVSISHPGVLRSLIGAALFLAVMGLLGLGLGAIIRTTAGGISALVAMVFVIPPILELALPESAYNAISGYLPLNAGGAVWTISPAAHTLSPWAGFAVFCAYAVVALAIGAVLLRRRDV
jgi:ABC-type transport system involved in multi-copper enzyme maturation permease subunit